MKKTQAMMNGFQSSINKSMSGVGTAIKLGLGYLSFQAVKGIVQATTKVASDLTEVQNVVDVTFGGMVKNINEFSKDAIDSFGLSELAAKKYSSTMGAMMKSSGIAGDAVVDMSLDLTKLTADMASFYNLENDEAFRKIMSGMSGMSMPLKELGVNMNVANLEAFALSQGIGKAYSKMSQSEQTILRYNYLMSVTSDSHGDFARNSYNWGHQLKILGEQWTTLKGTIGAGFINILAPIVTGFNVLIKKIQVAAEYFKAFTVLIFGNTQATRQQKKSTVDLGSSIDNTENSVGGAGKSLGKAGKAGKKAGKDLKGSVAGFDEINKSASNTADSMGGLSDELDDVGGVGGIDLGSAEMGELDIDTSEIEGKFEGLKSIIEDFYVNWGMKDIFDGIKEGMELVDFSSIKENFKTTFEGWGEIASTALEALQPMFQAYGETLGTRLKYGIAIVGNIFEPISEGFANFTTNMKGPIQSWITETSQTMTNGYKNLNSIYENIGESWLNSINKYKPAIAKATEDTLTNVSETLMLIGTVMADTFEIVTEKLKAFTEENKESIQGFTDDILEIFTDGLGFINQIWTETLDLLKEFWDEWGIDFVEGVMDVVNDIGGWILYLWEELVKPIWDVMLAWMKKIWDESLKDIVEELLGFVGRVGDLIMKLWEEIFKPLIDNILEVLVPVFEESFHWILDIVGIAVNGIGGVIKGLLKILNGLIDFLVGAFTGDWRRAWEGVARIFEGIMNGLTSMFKIPFNIIISGINAFLRALNKIKIPDWVPGVGGYGFSMEEIPHLAKGGIVDRPTLAVVGEAGKEAVMPLENNTGWIDNLAGQIATGMMGTMQPGSSQGSGDTTIIVKIGEDTITEKVVNNINRQSRISGKTIITV